MDVNSELKDAQLEILATDKAHSVNTKGMVWFNKTTDKIKAFFNSEVKTIATEDWVNDEVTNSETNLKNNGLITVEQAGTPATPATGEVNVYAKNDGLYYINDAGTEVQLAGTTLQKVTDIYTIEVNVVRNTAGTSTAFTVPSGYTWSFTGVANAGITYQRLGYRRVIFDGKTFAGDSITGDDAANAFSYFGVMGSGTNTGGITVYWPDSVDVATLVGIATLYKKQ